MKAALKKKGYLTQYQKGVPNKVAGTFISKDIKHFYLADESTKFTRSEAIVNTTKNGNGDYNVAQESSKVVKCVHSNCEKRHYRFRG